MESLALLRTSEIRIYVSNLVLATYKMSSIKDTFCGPSGVHNAEAEVLEKCRWHAMMVTKYRSMSQLESRHCNGDHPALIGQISAKSQLIYIYSLPFFQALIHAHTYKHTHTHTHTLTHTHSHSHTHTHTHTHSHSHKHNHTLTHTHTHVDFCFWKKGKLAFLLNSQKLCQVCVS